MDKNIRINKKNGSEYGYGKDVDNAFGYQDGIIEKFLDKRLGGRTSATLNVSTTPKPGTLEVSLRENLAESTWANDTFKVTQPRALRGALFCKTGIQRYFGKAVAQQKRLKLYVKL